MAATGSIADQAAQLLGVGAVERAVQLVSQAAQRGDANAINELALWHVYGHPLRRDFGLARQLFGRASEAGHRKASITYAVLVALGAGTDPDFPAAIKLLDAAAATDPVAAQQLGIISAMDIDENGRPRSYPNFDRRASSPTIGLFPSLFSPAECAHLIALSKPLLAPSIVVNSLTGKQSPNPVRTSFGAVLGPIQQDMVVHILNMRIATATGSNIDQGEPLVVLRYEAGQQYREHHDCLPGETNQRVETAIVYLNDDYQGGETTFPASGIAIKGRTGDALSFANTLADGGVDEGSRHAGQPVERGVKWVCTRWIRREDFDPWGLRTPSLHVPRGSN